LVTWNVFNKKQNICVPLQQGLDYFETKQGVEGDVQGSLSGPLQPFLAQLATSPLLASLDCHTFMKILEKNSSAFTYATNKIITIKEQELTRNQCMEERQLELSLLQLH
jgi:ABC-type molybdate transport system substrate-binding protein